MAMQTFDLSDAGPDIPFRLGTEVFHAVGTLPSGVMLDFASLPSMSPEEEATLTEAERLALGQKSMAGLTEFFNAVIVEKDQPRWQKILRTQRGGKVLDLPVLIRVSQWLGAEYANPTGASSDGSSGSPATGSVSSDGAPSGATTYKRKRTPAAASR